MGRLPGGRLLQSRLSRFRLCAKNENDGNPMLPKWYTDKKEKEKRVGMGVRRESRSPSRGGGIDLSIYGQDEKIGKNEEGLQRERRRNRGRRDTSGADTDDTGGEEGMVVESEWVTSDLNTLHSDCMTNLRILPLDSASIHLQDNATVSREYEDVAQHGEGGGGASDVMQATLIDTGA